MCRSRVCARQGTCGQQYACDTRISLRACAVVERRDSLCGWLSHCGVERGAERGEECGVLLGVTRVHKGLHS